MKITAIKPAVKTQGRYNVFVDESYGFSLDETQLLDEKLHTGLEIDAARLESLQDESAFGKKYMRALELIARRPRSHKEIKDYARRKKWQPEEYERVSSRLADKGYLDDKKFARFWLRARAAGKPSSRRKLVAELRQKGISTEAIEEAFNSDDAPDDKEALRVMLAKKRHVYDDKQKLIAYLARQGFSYDDIKQAIES